MKRSIILGILICLCMSMTALAGGPIHRVEVPPPPAPQLIYVPPPPPPAPKMRGEFGATVFMTDYRAALAQNSYPTFNFGDAFGWSARAAVMEYTLGVKITDVADGSFTYITPLTRSGVGIPTVPISVGGYIFGPRTGDTISLKTSLSGERFLIATPALISRACMPTGMCEWWHLHVTANGTPNTTTTSQAIVEVKQDFNKTVVGFGLSGELIPGQGIYGYQPPDLRSPFVSYTALYTTGGHTHGVYAEVGVGYKQHNMSALIGFRYQSQTMDWETGSLNVNANGAFARLSLLL